MSSSRVILTIFTLLSFKLIFVSSQSTAADKFFKSKNCDANCTFKEIITSQNIGFFPNCSRVCAYILLNQYTNVTQTKLATTFKNMKTLVGSLTIVNTNYTNAKFLAPLEGIECDNNTGIIFNSNEEMTDTGMTNLKYIDCPNFVLFGGKKMTKLNFPNLKSITYNTTTEISISFIAPLSSFCITTEEAKAFFSVRTPSSIALVTRYCEPELNQKTCQTPAAGCVEIFGNLVIGQDFQMETMKDVEVIYGYLVINGTELTNLGGFGKLKYIATLDYGVSALQIVDNPSLVNATFPALQRIYSNSIDEIIFKDNAEELLLDPWLCFGLRYLLSMDTEDTPNFDGESCEQVEKNLPARNVSYMAEKTTTTVRKPECRFKGLITSQNISTFPICSRVCAYLIFKDDTDVTEDQLTAALKNMKQLIGGLMIVGAPFTHTKFFESLEGIECDDIGITITRNTKLTDLGMVNLKSIDCPSFTFMANDLLTGMNMPKFKSFTYNESVALDIQIVAVQSTFCITTNEVRPFGSARFPSFVQIFSTYCQPQYTEKLCKTPAVGCIEMFGRVYIGPDFNIELIKNVEVIYGNLVINGTSLKNFDGFESLECIVSLDYAKTTLRVENNLNLVNAWFPKIQKMYSNGKDEILFNKNAPELLLDPELCYNYELISSEMKEEVAFFDDESCDEVKEKALARNKTYMESRPTVATTIGTIMSSSAPMEATTVGVTGSTTVAASFTMNLKLMVLLAIFCHFGHPKHCVNFNVEGSEQFFERRRCDQNCTFEYNSTNSQTIEFFPTSCRVVCANLFIGEDCDLTEEELTSAFKNMERLIGGLIVCGTNFTSGSFLAGVQSIDTEHDILWENNSELTEIGLTSLTSIIAKSWTISSNPSMVSLNIPNLLFTTPANKDNTHVDLYINPMSPDFCMSFDQMEVLLNIRKAELTNIYAGYCEPIPEDSVCTEPEEGCVRIFGDVVIDRDFDVNKMKSVESIFGSLTINGTRQKDFKFLENLKYVAPLGTKNKSTRLPILKGEKAIYVVNNWSLYNYRIPSLKRVRSEAMHPIVFDANYGNDYHLAEMCIEFETSLYMSRGPLIDRNTCYLVDQTKEKDNEAFSNPILVVVAFIGICFLLGICFHFCPDQPKNPDGHLEFHFPTTKIN